MMGETTTSGGRGGYNGSGASSGRLTCDMRTAVQVGLSSVVCDSYVSVCPVEL